MTDISRHPLLAQAYEVCQEIEKCGASPQLTAAVTKASALLRDLDAFIPVTSVSYAGIGDTLAQKLMTAFLDAWRDAEMRAYDYSHSLPEGPERDYALGIYHRVRLLFSNGKSAEVQDATAEAATNDENSLILKLQGLGEEFGCPGGVNRIEWLRAQLTKLQAFETNAFELDGADFSDALMWLKEGHLVARDGWNGKGQYVKWIRGFGPIIGFEGCEVAGCLVLKNAQGVVQPGWVPSQGDLMANDWELVNEWQLGE